MEMPSRWYKAELYQFHGWASLETMFGCGERVFWYVCYGHVSRATMRTLLSVCKLLRSCTWGCENMLKILNLPFSHPWPTRLHHIWHPQLTLDTHAYKENIRIAHSVQKNQIPRQLCFALHFNSLPELPKMAKCLNTFVHEFYFGISTAFDEAKLCLDRWLETIQASVLSSASGPSLCSLLTISLLSRYCVRKARLWLNSHSSSSSLFNRIS